VSNNKSHSSDSTVPRVQLNQTTYNTEQDSEKPDFLRKPNPLIFGVLLGFGFYWVFGFFI